ASSPVAAAPEAVGGGWLHWGVKSAFSSYITGPIANGSITLTPPATRDDVGTFAFVASSGTFDRAASTVTAGFDGGIWFRGHDYENGPLLEVAFTNVRVEVSGNSGVVIADVASR
ncbi:MAG TPA: HtaA domain-containing protein, partial [Ilumatobacteraceae bacterium]|nr:HtaA domain-containing protein [Ilumatobacteraceae bacterium]